MNYLSALFLMQTFKKKSRSWVMIGCRLWDQDGLIALYETFFFLKNHYYNFDVPLGLFDCIKFKKSLEWIHSYDHVSFLDLNYSISKSNSIFLIYLLPSFVV